MIIKDKPVWVYDIEVFINILHMVIKNTETHERIRFEISERKNQLNEICQFFHMRDKDYRLEEFLVDDKILCGYNNKHYDDVIINYLIYYQWIMRKKTWFEITKSVYNLSQVIIKDDDINKWKKWKYLGYFYSIDLLTMRFSSKLRVGLKEMEVTMQFPNVEEYDGDFEKPLPLKDFDKMIAYNDNDVDATEELLNRSQKLIDLRLGIEQEYGVDVLSKDGMTIGMEILKVKYLERTGKTWDQIKDLRSPCEYIELNKVILPFVKFEHPVLKEMLVELKQQVVSPGRKGYEKHFLLEGMEVSVGVGGIHSRNDPEIIIPNENQLLLDSDVNSLYPSLSISYKFIPPHLGLEFLDVYSNIRTERLEAKFNCQKIKNETLKLALNGESGNLQQQHSWIYSPETAMKIRMNGQMLLLMLCERLLNIGATLKQVNTDGVLYLIDKNRVEDLNRELKEWEEQTKLTLETEEFEAFYQYAVNDYFGVLKGYSETKNPNLIKEKGMFVTNFTLGKGMPPKIIPEAIMSHFLDKTNPNEYLHECNDLNKFVTYQKVGKQFKVYHGDKPVVHINRFYYSTTEPYLLKYDPIADKYISVNTKSGVRIVNKMVDNKIPKDLNYRYYLYEIWKIIRDFENRQLTLF